MELIHCPLLRINITDKNSKNDGTPLLFITLAGGEWYFDFGHIIF
jgi:hypothetical protein